MSIYSVGFCWLNELLSLRCGNFFLKIFAGGFLKNIFFAHNIIYKLSRSILVFIFSLIFCTVFFSKIVSYYQTDWGPDLSRLQFHFFVAVSAEQGPYPVELVTYFQAKESGRALVVPPNGLSIQVNGVESQKFNVQSVAGEGAVIETVFNGDDYVFTSRYILKDGNVSPIMFRSYGPGHAMMGFLFAFIFCYIVFAILRGVFKERPSETP